MKSQNQNVRKWETGNNLHKSFIFTVIDELNDIAMFELQKRISFSINNPFFILFHRINDYSFNSHCGTFWKTMENRRLSTCSYDVRREKLNVADCCRFLFKRNCWRWLEQFHLLSNFWQSWSLLGVYCCHPRDNGEIANLCLRFYLMKVNSYRRYHSCDVLRSEHVSDFNW